MRTAFAWLVGFMFVVAGCTTPRTDGGSGTATGNESWRSVPLRDVVTGGEFRISDFEGKVVAIEAMAIWCVNCRVQQGEAEAALEEIDSADLVYLSLDIDPNERAEDLADYARRAGFEWRFAVASPEVSASLVASFGDQILSPPSTPLVVLGPDGQVVEQSFGIKSANDLAALFSEHLP